jgi:hypothetical protein
VLRAAGRLYRQREGIEQNHAPPGGGGSDLADDVAAEMLALTCPGQHHLPLGGRFRPFSVPSRQAQRLLARQPMPDQSAGDDE